MGFIRRMQLIKDYLRLFPKVRQELRRWVKAAQAIPSPLREQALASINNKAFHCLGGAVYAVYPGAMTEVVLGAIVALQTISDYLDNLCDRLDVTDEAAFRRLHKSFLQALELTEPSQDYYQDYPYGESTYLPGLVRACQENLSQLPYYRSYQRAALYLATHYCELQVRKHVGRDREKYLQEWIGRAFPKSIKWQEWAAAAGSTLGIFFCFALASQAPAVREQAILDAYFPWTQGLHILLDYLIDQGEDKLHGDLNFTFYYSTRAELCLALQQFAQESRIRARALPHSYFHHTVIDGLVALYGSDPKAKAQGQRDIFHQLSKGSSARYLLPACLGLRRMGVIS
ncbi:MAG TPA: DUF2600 family protein [Firmicutes bacterium]|jgi:tetraprenyl-beta-curcumene synthase|nr:DUF2600 family protein [Bacillota bacterium]